jgi:hypothetical protein
MSATVGVERGGILIAFSQWGCEVLPGRAEGGDGAWCTLVRVGAWGPGVFQNDHALDLRNRWRDLVGVGFDPRRSDDA